MQNVHKCITCPINLYQYLIGRDGQTIQIGHMEKNYRQCLVICDKIINTCKMDNLSCKANKYIRYKFFDFLEGVYRAAIIGNYGKDLNSLIDFDINLKKNHYDIYDRLGKANFFKKGNIKYIYLFRKKKYRIGILFSLFCLLYNKCRCAYYRIHL